MHIKRNKQKLVQVWFNSSVHILKCMHSFTFIVSGILYESGPVTQCKLNDEGAFLPPTIFGFICLSNITQEQFCGTFDTVFDCGFTTMRLHQLLRFAHIIQVAVELRENRQF